MSIVHVVYDGQTQDIEFNDLFSEDRLASLGLNTSISPSDVSQAQVKMALSQHYDRGLNEFNDHFVEINPNGNITVRPNTKFG